MSSQNEDEQETPSSSVQSSDNGEVGPVFLLVFEFHCVQHYTLNLAL